MDIFLELPLGWAIVALFGLAMMRSNATYWLGRGVAAGARHTALEKHLDSAVMRRAERLMDKYGPFAVTLCFLTVGLQTAVIASAGIARMHLGRFLPAVIAGSVIWAIVYATVGLAAVAAWIGLVLASPAAAVVIALLLAIVVGCVIWRRKRREHAARAEEARDAA